MRSKRARILAALAAAWVAVQFVPLRPDNPPVTGALSAPGPVQLVLRRACADCHSNETRWPWYAHVAPVGWLMVEHVRDGRAELNLSRWAELSPEQQARARSRAWHEVEEGKMPLPSYLWLHRAARLSAADRAALQAWAAGAPAGPEPPPGNSHDPH